MRPVDGQRLPSAHLRFSPLFSRRIGYLHLSRFFRHFKSSYYNTVRENRPSGRRFPIPLPGSVIRLIRPFRGFTGDRLAQSSRKGRSLHKVIHLSPAGTTPRHSGLFPPFGRASIDRRQRLRLGSRSSGTALHFLPLGIPSPARAGFTGHSRRVSPSLFPNADVPAPSNTESRRLSERFSSRLCTELQNGLEELVITFLSFQGARAFRPSREGTEALPSQQDTS